MKAISIPPLTSDGKPRPWTLNWDTEWADPAPVSHLPGTSSYARHTTGWSSHELSGVRLAGMKVGDRYQLQLVIVHPTHEETLWSTVLKNGVATTGDEYTSVDRTLHSVASQRVRWRVTYLGTETDVKVIRAEWIIKEY